MADFIHSMNLLIVSNLEGCCLGLKPIYGVHPVSSKNRVCWVMAWTCVIRAPNRKRLPCYQGTVSVLSGHPRWIFRKNSMEFFVGLQPYLYYCYSGCTLGSHDHMSFPECSMVTWPCHVTFWLTKSLFCLLLRCMLGILSLGVQGAWETFSYSRFSQHSYAFKHLIQKPQSIQQGQDINSVGT